MPWKHGRFPLNFRQLPVANGTAFSNIIKKEDNLARCTQIFEIFFSGSFAPGICRIIGWMVHISEIQAFGTEFLEIFPGNFCTICRFFQIFESFGSMESAPYEGNKCVGSPKKYLSLQALYAVFTNKKSSILKEGRVPSKQLRSSGVLMEVNQVSCHILNWITKVKCGSWRKIWKSCYFEHLHFLKKHFSPDESGMNSGGPDGIVCIFYIISIPFIQLSVH